MAYVGIQTMLLAYKMRKSDKEFELMQITQDKLSATKQSTELYEGLNAQYNNDLADIAAWENELEQKEQNAQSEISYLNGYINSWQSALSEGIKKAHNYGATSS